MQRGYDQLVHDICLTKQHVVILVDRAGNTGNDGETHHGIFDLAFLNTIPNMVIMAPKNFNELECMLEFALNYTGPIAIRYPKGSEEDFILNTKKITLGKSEVLLNGKDVTIVAFGKMVVRAYKIAKSLEKDNISAEVINLRFLKPLDIDTIKKSFSITKKIVTIEDGDAENGLGETIKKYFDTNKVLSIGYPNTYLPHGKIEEIEKLYQLDEESIYLKIKEFMKDK